MYTLICFLIKYIESVKFLQTDKNIFHTRKENKCVIFF